MQSVNPLDEAAFTELYVQHVDAVYRICYSFLKSYRCRRCRSGNIPAVDAIAKTIGKRCPFKRLVSGNCFQRLQEYAAQLAVAKRQEVEDWEEVLKSDNQTPEETAVLKALMQLPEKYKTVLYLYYYEEYSCKGNCRNDAKKKNPQCVRSSSEAEKHSKKDRR